ncbi:MAG: ParA family protein [Lachnospiraceae bacterium]|nr:ParA family protein [Lachnospiraceae bacterium]
MFDKNFNLICGHYGCGKTNLAVNAALNKAKEGKKVILVDLDLVNPYFRSSDYAEMLKEYDVKVIAPVYAHSNVDIPSLPADINGIFDTDACVILDIGGDDVGATVLGRFTSRIAELDYEMYYVINKYRNLTATADDAVEVLREIEGVSRLKATAIINNSHLKDETTPEVILDSVGFAAEVSEKTGLPVVAFTAAREFEGETARGLSLKWAAETKKPIPEVYPVEVYVKTSWEG